MFFFLSLCEACHNFCLDNPVKRKLIKMMSQGYLIHLLLQTAVSDVMTHHGAVVKVPLSVFSYRHRAWICRVDPRPTKALLAGFIGCHEV